MIGSLAGLGLAAALGRPAKAAEPLKLVAFGDSLTAGYGLPPKDGFVPKLEAAVRAGGRAVAIANAGVSGDTSTGGADRLEWSIPDGTDGVIVELGANDMLRGTDPKVTKAALTRILDRLEARKIPVMLTGMLASPNLGDDYVKAFAAVYADLARARGLVFYRFFLDGVAGDRTYNQPDGVHPNARGVDVIVGRILPNVEAFVDRISAARR